MNDLGTDLSFFWSVRPTTGGIKERTCVHEQEAGGDSQV